MLTRPRFVAEGSLYHIAFAGNAEIFWELSRNVLQGVTKADLVEIQKQGACEEVMRRSHGCFSPIMVSIVT